MKDIITILARSPLFRGLDDTKIESIADVSTNVEFAEGAFILEHGQEANDLYLITAGVVSLEITHDFKTSVLETLHSDEVLGLSWMNYPVRWMFDARAMKKVKALKIPASFLLNLCESDHKSGYIVMKNLVKIVTERLQASRMLLLDIYSSSQTPSRMGG
jgi:CRP-like cAMP-binding protein